MSIPFPSRRQSMISFLDTVNDRRIIAMFCDFRVSRMKTCEGGPDIFWGFEELVGVPRGDFLLAATVPNSASIKSPLNLNHGVQVYVRHVQLYNALKFVIK